MRKVKKILLFMAIFIVVIMIKDKVYAASASILASSTSITTGSTATITVSVSNTEAWDLKLSSSGGTLGGTTVVADAAAEEVSQTVMTATFSASTAGTYTITLSGDITGSDLSKQTVSGKTVTITVSNPSSSSLSSSSSETSSSSTTTSSSPVLTNLGITPYDFTGFRSGTTSYSVTVPNDCTSVTIYAKAASDVSITGTGIVTLKEGTNKYTITASNSAGSTTYTLSIIRKTEETEIIPNVVDEEETEEIDSTGIGLTELSITGYDFLEEFGTGVYEYTVIITEALTEEDLEEIKNLITATVNSEEVYVEIETQLNEDGTAVITIIVKDDEREYATYVINFVFEDSEEEEVFAVAGITLSDNSSGNFFDSLTNRVFLILGILVGAVFLALIIARIKYKRSQELDEYGMDEMENEDNLISTIYSETNGRPLDYKEEINYDNIDKEELSGKISEMLKDDSKIPEYSISSEETEILDEEIIDKKSNPIDLFKKTEGKIDDLGGYRNRRSNFGTTRGKH